MWNVCLKGLYISVFLSWFWKWPEGDLPLYIQYLSMGTETLQVILSAACVRIAALYLLGSFCFHVWWLYLYQMIETICLWPEDIYSMVQYNSKCLVSVRGCHVKMQSRLNQFSFPIVKVTGWERRSIAICQTLPSASVLNYSKFKNFLFQLI